MRENTLIELAIVTRPFADCRTTALEHRSDTMRGIFPFGRNPHVLLVSVLLFGGVGVYRSLSLQMSTVNPICMICI